MKNKTGFIKKINWLEEPDSSNYPASHSYLSLIFTEEDAAILVDKLKKATTKQFKAKDIFRASSLSLLGISNKHVEKDIKKIKKDTAISPLLLVRDTKNRKLIIADGYHRLCAIYTFDEDANISCRIV